MLNKGFTRDFYRSSSYGVLKYYFLVDHMFDREGSDYKIVKQIPLKNKTFYNGYILIF